jgi:hypothetical protein
MSKEKGCAVSFVVERNGFKDGEQATITAQSEKIFITAVGKLQIAEGDRKRNQSKEKGQHQKKSQNLIAGATPICCLFHTGEALQQSWHENMMSVFPEGKTTHEKEYRQGTSASCRGLCGLLLWMLLLVLRITIVPLWIPVLCSLIDRSLGEAEASQARDRAD